MFEPMINSIEENKVYILMNKPKNTVTTLSDENGRMTVRDIIGDKVKERINLGYTKFWAWKLL